MPVKKNISRKGGNVSVKGHLGYARYKSATLGTSRLRSARGAGHRAKPRWGQRVRGQGAPQRVQQPTASAVGNDEGFSFFPRLKPWAVHEGVAPVTEHTSAALGDRRLS